jgi:2-polyprenyl-3-methyl-5-hydroxy-6-metoxy-1,4-benzoquinol methylase/tetratricopeptide (TPR) repeat protein
MIVTKEQGVSALKAGDYASAVVYFEGAIETDPGNGGTRYNLAQALRHVGREGDAIIQATRALALDPGLNQAARLLSYLLNQFKLRNPCGIDPVGLCAAFNFIDVDHQLLASTALSYLKQCTSLQDAIILGGARDWDAGAQWLLSSKGRGVLRDPLLLTVLSLAANTDIDIERLLTALRKALLLTPTRETLRKGYVLEFACALVRQSEINEFVFFPSDEERQRLDEIYINFQGLREGSRAAAENLLLKALYSPLWRLLNEDAEDIDGRMIKPNVWSDLVAAHLKEKQVEREIAQGIQSVGMIEDTVSRSVAQLYEDNPYPRWLSMHLPGAGSRRKQLACYFPDEELTFMDAPYKVLIAGSGTGQQTLDAALGYGPQGAITAIDISLASLAYAKRMADKFGADNIQFLQCDILNAGVLDDAFDIIECIGVLHHMDDPWGGWKVLAGKLNPGGMMKIALYSQAARRTIALLRDDICTSGLSGDAQTIRKYRQDIITGGDQGKGGFLRQSSDFYSLSNFRDLMFHVSEQHMTIPDIAGFLRENDFTFQGFQLPIDINEGYPHCDAVNDLEHWHAFEEQNPDTFKGMYVFWCRKE